MGRLLFIATLCSSSMLLLLLCSGVSGSTFMLINKCNYTVWPGILSNAGCPALEPTGFELPMGTSISIQPPTGWSGRFWGRTACAFDAIGSGNCKTGDCGTNHVLCKGQGASTPVTLVEFALASGGGKDFYDVSLVDGFNLPVVVVPIPRSPTAGITCASTGCVADLTSSCPDPLRGDEGYGCKSACVAFGKPEYCCTGPSGTQDTCPPTEYSEIFKTACPTAYSYAFDDATSTFTCADADYSVTFCPATTSIETAPAVPTATTPNTDFSGEDDGNSMNGESRVSGSSSGSGSEVTTDESWLAGLAMGDSTITGSPIALQFLTLVLTLILCSIYL